MSTTIGTKNVFQVVTQVVGGFTISISCRDYSKNQRFVVHSSNYDRTTVHFFLHANLLRATHIDKKSVTQSRRLNYYIMVSVKGEKACKKMRLG